MISFPARGEQTLENSGDANIITIVQGGCVVHHYLSVGESRYTNAAEHGILINFKAYYGIWLFVGPIALHLENRAVYSSCSFEMREFYR